MRTLLLTSQGIQPEIKETFLKILPKEPEDIAVSFVTTAAYGEEKDPAWLEVYRNQLRGFGITDIENLDIRGQSYDELDTILQEKDIVFVNGGNTFFLLKEARESGFTELIPTLVKQGLIYVGVSAGSYIACPTIEQSNWKRQDRNHVGLTDLSAMDMVPFLVVAHYNENNRLSVTTGANKTGLPVIALTDRQAVLVQDGRPQVVGEGERLLFNWF